VKVSEIDAKSVLVQSKLPDTDFVINPYTGCEFGCAYCYASFMGRFVGERIEDWGNYVYVKKNAVSVLEKELSSWPQARRHASILMSSVTDPYQGIESKYQLTRGILEILAREQYPGLVSVLTKSPLVLRDVGLLKQLPQVEVGMTITTTDDRLSRFLEVRAPLASRRLKTLAELHEHGLPTYAFVGPLLPHFRYKPDLLEEVFASLSAVGVGSVFVEHINLKPYIRQRLWNVLDGESEEVRAVYSDAVSPQHRQVLEEMVLDLLGKYSLRMRLNQVLLHESDAR
jgi:DNA repair photolyase